MGNREHKEEERRDTPRIAIALDAVVNCGAEGLQHMRTRNLSLDGVFIEGSLAQHAAGATAISIELSDSGQPHFHRFLARKVRTESTGAGFSFEFADSETYAALLGFIFTQQPPGAGG